MATEIIPGLFDKSQSNHSIAMAAPLGFSDEASKSTIDELMAEKGSLGPNFVHSNRLLDQEIARVKSGAKETAKVYLHMDGNKPQTEKIYVPLELQKQFVQHNLVGRLLGPKGMTLKAIQSESRTRISILGKGSLKDRRKEEELRNSNEPLHAHLKDELHVSIEALPPYSNMKLAAGVSEINKMLIPPIPGQPDTLLAHYLDPQLIEGYAASHGARQSPSEPGPSPRGGRGRDGMGPPSRGRGRGSGMDRMRGGGGGRGGGRGGRGGYDTPRGGRSGRGGSGGGRDFGDTWREPRGDTNRLRGDEFIREPRERPFREERGLGDYGRSSEPYSGDTEPYLSFADKPVRSSQYGRESIPSNDYHHGSGSSEWKAPRAGRREGMRHHPYAQSSGGGGFF